MTEGCVFCAIAAGDEPSHHVFGDDRVVVIMDINPATDGHCLVVSRAHAENIWELTDEDSLAVWRAAVRASHAVRSALKPEGLTLFQANGRAGFQDVFHFHMHVVPRWKGDGLVKSWTSTPGDPARIDEIATKLRGVI